MTPMGFEKTQKMADKPQKAMRRGSKSGNITAPSAHVRATNCDESGAPAMTKESLAHGTPNTRDESPTVHSIDSELARLIAAWPTLAAPFRAAMMAIVTSSFVDANPRSGNEQSSK
jgi:hypothetical protein